MSVRSTPARSTPARSTPARLLALSLLAAASIRPAASPASPPAQDSTVLPKTVVDLQPFRQSVSARIRASAGRSGIATLVNLNPAINTWYVLSVNWSGGEPASFWHLENPRPRVAQITLDETYSAGLVIVDGARRIPCDLFGSATAPGALETGTRSQHIYYPLCDGRLWLRNPAKGARTLLESATDFLRNQVWGGEKMIDLFHHVLSDRYRETAEAGTAERSAEAPAAAAGSPAPALLDPARTGRPVKPAGLGIALESHDATTNGMNPGAWYAAAGNPGIYVSIVQPSLIAPAILASYPRLVSRLDNVEATSLVYLIAFDADRFDVGFAPGTEHPQVNWSDRVVAPMKDSRLPGPDGIGAISPLISTGLIRPDEALRTVATFTGGFKRNHGAFRSGALAMKNSGSHYGFIVSGVVLSRLQPGLATLFVTDDGSLEMKTWQDSDNTLLRRIRYARQNGVPLLEPDAASGAAAPGGLVNRWGAGNWSGSEDEKLRTIRAGLALARRDGKRFLIYAVFSDATPSAMARVFQAYRCDYAMLTDMNALEHTYLAVYRRSGGVMTVDHLLTGMSVLDKSVSGEVVPRFLGYPDNRDFFYVMRRTDREARP